MRKLSFRYLKDNLQFIIQKQIDFIQDKLTCNDLILQGHLLWCYLSFHFSNTEFSSPSQRKEKPIMLRISTRKKINKITESTVHTLTTSAIICDKRGQENRLQNSRIFCERERRSKYLNEDHAYGASHLPNRDEKSQKTPVLQSNRRKTRLNFRRALESASPSCTRVRGRIAGPFFEQRLVIEPRDPPRSNEWACLSHARAIERAWEWIAPFL